MSLIPSLPVNILNVLSLSRLGRQLTPGCALLGEVVNTHGPVEPDKDNIRQEPYTLPQGFTWDALDLGDRGVVSRPGLQAGLLGAEPQRAQQIPSGTFWACPRIPTIDISVSYL